MDLNEVGFRYWLALCLLVMAYLVTVFARVDMLLAKARDSPCLPCQELRSRMRFLTILMTLCLAMVLCGCGTAPLRVETCPVAPVELLIPPQAPVPLAPASGWKPPGITRPPTPRAAPLTGSGISV